MRTILYTKKSYNYSSNCHFKIILHYKILHVANYDRALKITCVFQATRPYLVNGGNQTPYVFLYYID